MVSDVKGMYKCFGCGKGGDVISFIKEYEKIDFNEALQRLSELTNIALEYDKAQKVGKSPSEVLEKINTLAKAELQKHKEIIEYLAARGITQEICERYDIGLVPSTQELLKHFSAEELVESNFANKEIIEYLAARGITQEICERYDIGLVPSTQELLKHFSAEELVESNFANTASVFGRMDRHALQSKARDDNKKADSRRNAPNLNTPQDSRNNEQRNNSTHAKRRQDFEARIGALQGERGDKAGCLSHKRATAIHDSSPKANAQNIAIPMHHRISIAIRNPQHKVVAFVARTHPHYNFNKNAPRTPTTTSTKTPPSISTPRKATFTKKPRYSTFTASLNRTYKRKKQPL